MNVSGCVFLPAQNLPAYHFFQVLAPITVFTIDGRRTPISYSPYCAVHDRILHTLCVYVYFTPSLESCSTLCLGVGASRSEHLCSRLLVPVRCKTVVAVRTSLQTMYNELACLLHQTISAHMFGFLAFVERGLATQGLVEASYVRLDTIVD
jgi:hypothetical protein